ncbi:DUF4142 domain-containing protein [Phytohalomonas tamaricis]|uniref:DUF4142 domain-containing protein n=1 Tax=Phytohalomonas tamaricis TaxID=2081032 RepID=UPI001319C079|nr:DUF4142 domain-containing protein [Phytohalomonas tamaricis]
MLTQRNTFFAGAFALTFAALTPFAHAQQGNQGNTANSDAQLQQNDEEMTPENFVDGASAINMGELDAVEMALDDDKDVPPEVKQVAQKIQKDHTQANQKLKQIAESKDLDMSATANMTSMASAPRLMVEDGKSFAADFAKLQVTAHKEAIAFFERASNELQDQELKQYATNALPKLKEHLQMAQDLQQKFADQ